MVITSDTKLDAVNSVLEAIGESPVGTLENPTNVDVINALRMLDGISRRLQVTGWPFNTYPAYKLNPDITEHKIRWNSDILGFKATNGTRYIKRGDYLYDMDKQTDVIMEPVEAKVVLMVAFEDLPDPLRYYVAAKTAKEFQLKYLGDAALSEELARLEVEAWQEVIDYCLEMDAPNMFNNPSVQEIASRG